MYGIYFSDLAASAVISIAFVFLFRSLGASGFIWICGGVALSAFVLYSWKIIRLRLMISFVGLFGVCVVLIGGAVSGGPPEPYKTLGRFRHGQWPTARFEATEWTPISRIDVVSDATRDLVFGRYDPDGNQMKMITQDSDAFTVILGPRRIQAILDQAKTGELGGSLDAVYALNPQPKDALVIGVGGGIDMVKARAHGAQHITGIEINSSTVDLLQGQYMEQYSRD
jgi:hypothetical protein